MKITATTSGLFPLGQGYVVDVEAFGMADDGQGGLRMIPNAGPKGSELQSLGGPVSLAFPGGGTARAKVSSPSGVYSWRLFRNVIHDDFAGPDAEGDVSVTVYVSKPKKSKVAR